MKTISLTKGKVTIVDDNAYEFLNQWKWHTSNSGIGEGYAVRTIHTKDKRFTLQMSSQITGCKSPLIVDHINGDTLDNRKENLRVCTRGQNNIAFKKKRKGSSSKFRGVAFNKQYGTKKWEAKISLNGVCHIIGSYATPEEAARAYDKKAFELYGEFACPNFADSKGEK